VKPFLFLNTPFEIPTYFALSLLAYLGAIVLGTKKAKRDGLSPVRAVDVGIVIFISGSAGARLLHVLAEAPAYYLQNPLRVFYFWQGGFVLYGGILFGILCTYLFLRFKKEPIGRWADVIAPCLLLGIGIGRAGCLSAGCCYGHPTDWFWGMVFTDSRSAAPLNVALHPTQALEMIFGLTAALAFWKIFPGPTKRPGIAFVAMIMTYSIFRFLIEFLRGDSERGVYLNSTISISQIISIGVILFCLGWLLYFREKSERIV
jgi:phosphatidylglycerol:prolipoprotein diacylglycerol transferase